MDDKNKVRRDVFRTLIITTAAVLLIIAAAISVARLLPPLRRQMLNAALSAGDTGFARSIAVRLSEEEQAAALQQCSYIEAGCLMDKGEYSAAAALYAAAGDYEDASSLRKTCDYEYAASLDKAGQWDEAAEIFRSLGGYNDSADRALQCRLSKAKSLLDSGEKLEAALELDRLSSLDEARSLLLPLVVELTGIDDSAKALAAFRGMSEEELALMQQLTALRASLPMDIISVGFQHTVGLGSDGRVYACGDNSFGQCDTGQWRDSTAVAAGAWHTAALLSDGRVVCTGQNTFGQCDTGDWQNVVQIAAGDYSTFALCEDGSVLSTGFLDYEYIQDWSDMRFICAGSYGVAALREDDSLWFYPQMTGTDRLLNVGVLDIATGYVVAALLDGTVVCTGCTLPAWQNVLSVSASGTAILALKADGGVQAHFFRESDSLDFSSVSNAVAIAAGGTHFAVVYSDGSVRIFGQCSEGQGDTQAWSLAVN